VTLYRRIHDCIVCPAVDDKLALVAALRDDLASRRIAPETDPPPPEPIAQPGRPARPALVAPEQVPRRNVNTPEGRAALIHALAHIEFNAIHLALDAAYRFRDLPDDFRRDWIGVAAEEAHHFRLLRDHLRGMGRDYGDFDAHNGLWDLAMKTAHDALARMALVPRLMEARGLDVSPGIRAKLLGAGDADGAAILDIILRDEIGHVAIGNRWYRWLCERRGLDPRATFARLLAEHGLPAPRGPFNVEARLLAGFEVGEWEARRRP
jgi:uncharacterized ferritin-like protein (DUF455 family)